MALVTRDQVIVFTGIQDPRLVPNTRWFAETRRHIIPDLMYTDVDDPQHVVNLALQFRAAGRGGKAKYNERPVLCESFNNRDGLIDGNHRQLAAYITGIQVIPAYVPSDALRPTS